jgi:hypothetical protein
VSQATNIADIAIVAKAIFHKFLSLIIFCLLKKNNFVYFHQATPDFSCFLSSEE